LLNSSVFFDSVSSATIWNPLSFRIALTVCFSATCEISWASTPASSASVAISPSAPRVMWMNPPGAAKAFTPSVSSTMNLNGRFGRVLFFARSVPTSVT
jgi:hypothetical protein